MSRPDFIERSAFGTDKARAIGGESRRIWGTEKGISPITGLNNWTYPLCVPRLPRQFEKFFKSKGLNIEGFRRPVPESEHIGKDGIHPRGYNEAWERWIEKYGEQATREDVLKQLECLEREFGLPPLP